MINTWQRISPQSLLPTLLDLFVATLVFAANAGVE